jgi:hypothetical protein
MFENIENTLIFFCLVLVPAKGGSLAWDTLNL